MSKLIYREHIEQIWNNQDAGGIERFIAPNYRGFEAEEVISGIAGYKQHFVILTSAFPDMHLTIEALLAEEDRVVARWVVEATHMGDFGVIPPTGKRVRVTGIEIARFRNRQIVEQHAQSDALGLLKQLGVIDESVTVTPLLF